MEKWNLLKENKKLPLHYLVYKQWRKYFRRRDSKARMFLEKNISVNNRNHRESYRLFTKAGQPLLYLKTLLLLLNTTSKVRRLWWHFIFNGTRQRILFSTKAYKVSWINKVILINIVRLVLIKETRVCSFFFKHILVTLLYQYGLMLKFSRRQCISSSSSKQI